jgi:hypothetical protein
MNMNNRKRWIVLWKDSRTKPVLYHCLSRIVGRGFVLDVAEREHFRMLMRMCEKFMGFRVLSYWFSPAPPGATPSEHVAFAPVQTAYKPSAVAAKTKITHHV